MKKTIPFSMRAQDSSHQSHFLMLVDYLGLKLILRMYFSSRPQISILRTTPWIEQLIAPGEGPRKFQSHTNDGRYPSSRERTRAFVTNRDVYERYDQGIQRTVASA